MLQLALRVEPHKVVPGPVVVVPRDRPAVVKSAHTSVLDIPRHVDDFCFSKIPAGQVLPRRMRLEDATTTSPGGDVIYRFLSRRGAHLVNREVSSSDDPLQPGSLPHGVHHRFPSSSVGEEEHDLLHPGGAALGVGRHKDIRGPRAKPLLQRLHGSLADGCDVWHTMHQPAGHAIPWIHEDHRLAVAEGEAAAGGLGEAPK
mmetsp:Transcript_3755/g.10993  ORF Transcript_3755/g.10993 Transcript_3755/m.10993 type:complete len:201 (+) Transcript_3755:869-1471(+)